MELIDKDEIESRKIELFEKIKAGAVFIYGTDTIYGIGCDATNNELVKKIREIKGRATNPFSVIAPSKKWILENCAAPELESELGKLPGPYTLILNLKNKGCVSKQVNPGNHTLGVRIPEHWISNFVSEFGKPIITTSVNRKDEPFLTSFEELDPEIQQKVDFMINEGKISGNPSTLINLTKEKKQIIRR